MRIKVKLTPGYLKKEIDLTESYTTIPYIEKRNLYFFVKGSSLEINSNIWNQIPESEKDTVYNFLNSFKMNMIQIKSANVTITNISAYSISLGKENENVMEEIYETFNENVPMDEFEPLIIFPNTYGRFLVQILGDVYVEFDTEDIFETDFLYHKELDKILFNKGLREIHKKFDKNFFEKEDELYKKYYKREETEEEVIKKIIEFLINDIYVYQKNLSLKLEILLNLLMQKEQWSRKLPDDIKKKIEFWILEIVSDNLSEKEKELIREIKKKLNSKKIFII